MRSVTNFNERWFYLAGDTRGGKPPRFRDSSWQEIELPHVPEEGFPPRYWYCKALRIERMTDERVYLQVENPEANCRLFVGGREVERLRANGVYTIDLTAYHRAGRPIQAAFRFKGNGDESIGGFQRKISVYVVPRSHFSFDSKGVGGIHVSSEMMDKGAVKVKTIAAVLNPEEGQKISFAIGGPNVSVPVNVPAAEFAIPRPRYWTPGDPFLYSLRAILTGRDRSHLDTVDVRFGVREFKLSSDGLLWNKTLVPTRGIVRKTPRHGKGLPWEKELPLIGELGVDTLLLTGAPETDEFYSRCDSVGLRCFQTLPGLRAYIERKDAMEAAKRIVYRLCNNPSVVGYVVENDRDDSAVRSLCDLIRHADADRLIVLKGTLDEFMNMAEFPADIAAVSVTGQNDIVLLDKLREKKPKLPVALIQEDGVFDIPLAAVLRERPWLITLGAASLYHEDAEKKALLDNNNELEDNYFLLRSLWTPMKRPETDEGEQHSQMPALPSFVRICAFDKDNPKRVVAYSNEPKVSLSLEGKEIAVLEGSGIFIFEDVKIKKGSNQLLAIAGDATHARILFNI
ncbi:MAG: hypothetical protein FWG82_01290 [Oscillospiraceae bacterium]|nr:hypothetical protein [Oscillospiraceae bacterium]